MKRIIIIILTLALTACSTLTKDQSYRDKHPEMFIDFHKISNELKFEEKYKIFPQKFLDEISRQSQAENTKDWLVFNPKNIDLRLEQLNFINSEVRKIPQKIKDLSDKKLLYWGLVSNLGAAGLTTPVFPNNENEKWKSIILMNDDNLEMNYCDYVNQKEASVYSEGKYKISCITNKPISKFLVIYLHELSHVIGMTNYLVPHSSNLKTKDSINWYLFSRLSWEWDHKEYVRPKEPLMAEWQTNRKNFTKINADKRQNFLAVDDFNAWKKSSFVSMYSIFSPEEDWAEQMLHFILKKYFDVEIKYTLIEDGKVIQEVKPCENNANCILKTKLIEFFIENVQLFPE